MACRVLTVGNNTMMVEACGVDTEIYARNVSWEWFSDIADLHPQAIWLSQEFSM